MKVRTSLSLISAFLLSEACALGAASWRLTSTALFDVSVAAIAVDPRSEGTIYVGGATGLHFGRQAALFRSDDRGVTWRRIQQAFSGGLSVVSILINPLNPDVIYAGVYGRGVFKSVDAGETWTLLQPTATPWVLSLGIDERNPDTLYVVLAGDGVYRTTDAGATWNLISTVLPTNRTIFVTSLSIDPVDSRRIYAVDSAHQLFRSNDAGLSWQFVRGRIVRLMWIDPANSAVLYASQDDGDLVKSADRGLTWTSSGVGLPRNVSLGPLRGDPADPSLLYLGTIGAGVYRSIDGGLTWSALNEGLTNLSVNTLFVPSSGGFLLYAGTESGLFDYRDRGEFQITLPAVASLHGVPPAFFHSDVWVFNGSATNEAMITATYRCAQEDCGNAVQTFTIPSRQIRTFNDVVATLFGAPETFGAIEFDSRELIVVTSRLYTPARPEPTVGMFVPGLIADDAHESSVLTSLAHDSAFRTNVGLYNGNDVRQLVLLQFFESSGVFLGQFFDSVAPRRSLQINDAEVFARLGVGREVRDFYCVVTGDGVHPLYVYASVIDRRSQDPTFVRGEDAAGLRVAKITLPAVARVQGAGGTFFHSDVRVWNASAAFAEVTARFACFEGSCGERVFLVAPRQVLAWDDVVTSLFHSSSAGGAMEFVSVQPLVVTSRLYTPAPTSPTAGMFVPGLAPRRASPAVVVNGLSHPAEPSGGARVNVGVFNQSDVAQVVTYRLFDGSGVTIGQTSRSFASRETFQVNDIFAFLGVSRAVESAYCLIEGSELLPLFTYAAVIDNRSQDPIFVPGEDDPEHPPIVPLGVRP